MADDYVRETLRTLRERTGDAYVPLSEVLGFAAELRDMAEKKGDSSRKHWAQGFDRAGDFADGQSDALGEAAWLIERRWGPGPRCEQCGDTGVVDFGGEEPWLGGSAPCDCEAARG